MLLEVLSYIGLLLIIVESYLWGASESPVWYLQANWRKKLFNDFFHSTWTVQRGLSFIPIFILWGFAYHWWVLFGIAGVVGVFIFFHDGSYYYYRNKIDGSYPLGFRDVSKTSTAKTHTFDWKGRCALLTVGAMALFAMFYGMYTL